MATVSTPLGDVLDHGYEQRRIDTAFDVLSHPSRRLILNALMDADVSIDIGADSSRSDLDLVELHHCHFPKLEEVGYIERTGDTIQRGPNFHNVASYIDLLLTADPAAGESVPDVAGPPNASRGER